MVTKQLEPAVAVVGGAVQGTAAALRVAGLAGLLAFDELLLLGMRRFHGPWRTRVAKLFTRAGDARTYTVVGITLVATGRPIGLHVAMRMGVGCTLGALASQALKRTLNRARPTRAIAGFEALADDPDAFSFPSGHTAAAFGVAVALAGEPWFAGPLSLLLATGIALSRVYLGAHYPFDVLVGGLIGTGAGAAARVAVP
jgi:undecaprenyl-diphosphatase